MTAPQPLPRRRLGRTGLEVAAVGLGGAWWHQAGRAGTTAGIEAALELGIDFLDTYPGQDEDVWGAALQGRRDRVVLQAKVSSHVRNERTSDHSAAATRRSLEASLRDLRTDHVDIALIHGYDQPAQLAAGEFLDPLAPGNALDELCRLRDEGKVGHIGIGARHADVHARALQTGRIDVILTYLEYNLLTQTAAEQLFPLCRAADVGVELASPLAMGLLTGAEPDASRARRQLGDDGPERVRAMLAWCRRQGVDIRALALQFCLVAPVAGLVLPGQASAGQVRSSHAAAVARLPAGTWEAFGAAFGIPAAHRPQEAA